MKIKSRLLALIRRVRTDGLVSQLLRGSSSSFVVKVAGAGLGFGTEIVLARLMTLSGYGVYVYVWTWLTVLALICTLGFRGALVRLVPEFCEEKAWGRLQGVLRRSAQFVLACSVLVGGLVAAGSFAFAGIWETPQTPRMLALGMPALPFLALILAQQGVLQGLKSVVWADAPYLLVRRVLVGGGAVALWWASSELTAVEVIVLLTVVLAITYALGQLGVLRQLPSAARRVAPKFNGKKWLRIALPFLLISGASLVQNKADILMLGPITGVQEAGIYGAATRITALIAFGLNASNMIVAPMISELYSSGKHERMQRLIALASVGVFGYTVLAGGMLFVAGTWVLSFFGNAFTAGYAALVILILGNMANALAGPVGYVMTMTDNQWLASKAFGVGMVLNIALNAALIPFFGMVGAACATALSNTAWNVILAYAAWTKLGVNTTAWAFFRS
jgi:O-antigen/teichoic acid export membrane protein